jgi:ornithine--oxo-acid transaminase
MVEPIQGEKGVIVPPEGMIIDNIGYLRRVKEICEKYQVLLICDEIQTGLGRTGKLLCSMHDNVRPDIVILGKALSGGFMPVSAILCDNIIMNNIKPGEHGSTYGGNPLACAVSMTALDVLVEEKMSENSEVMGEYLISNLRSILKDSKIIKTIRGKGLFIGIEFIESDYADKFSKILLKNGLIAKPTQKNIIRFSPALIITKAQMDESLEIIKTSWKELIA